MRKLNLILLSASVMALVGCGKNLNNNPVTAVNPKAPGPCYDLTNGNWQNIYTPGYQFAINDQCLGASNDYCGEIFTYHPQANGTVILIVIATKGGSECLPMGSTTCAASFLANQNNNQLHVDCGHPGLQIQSNFQRF